MKRHACRILFVAATMAWASASSGGAIEYRDALDIALGIAVAPPPDEATGAQRTDRLTLSVADNYNYDNNIYRLPANVDLTTLPGIGANPSRQDSIDTASAGLDGEWLTGARQSVDVDLRADYNRFFQNSDLSNVSTQDGAAWNWGLGDSLSGKIGADYARLFGGFANTQVYSRDMINRTDYYASMRYQLGPRWGIFGGVLGSNYSVTSPQATYNNSDTKSFDGGFDFTSEQNRIGFDYRYNDSRAPNAALLNGVVFDPDFREDRARVLFRYALSEKTVIDASAGYLKRQYPSAAIGSFSGEIWRAALQWQPTPKTQLLVGVWQQLDADLTSQTDYFVDKGESLTPQWVASEKLSFSATVSRETQNYIGSNPVGPIPIDFIAEARQDTLTSETASLVYTPIRAITLTFSAGHVKRGSNISAFEYNDVQGTVNITYRFFRLGDQL
jgi:Putative beta-barrel porin 2